MYTTRLILTAAFWGEVWIDGDPFVKQINEKTPDDNCPGYIYSVELFSFWREEAPFTYSKIKHIIVQPHS